MSSHTRFESWQNRKTQEDGLFGCRWTVLPGCTPVHPLVTHSIHVVECSCYTIYNDVVFFHHVSLSDTLRLLHHEMIHRCERCSTPLTRLVIIPPQSLAFTTPCDIQHVPLLPCQHISFECAGNVPSGDTLGSTRSLDLIERGVVGVMKPFHPISIGG
jgi:hypothetical protein